MVLLDEGNAAERYPERMVAMPIASPLVRSLNLSTCVGIAVYEVLRQRRGGQTS
jgi:tRNA(Leu) C34 or U34 (ribose-2'-O)-methylase TrmL